LIALRAAKRLGAKLSVESKPGVGSTFTLAIPDNPADFPDDFAGTGSVTGEN
jgi:signal transduction histidine kinase